MTSSPPPWQMPSSARLPRVPDLTDSRYALIVGSVLGATAFIADLLFFQLPIVPNNVRDAYSTCWSATRDEFAANPATRAFADCIADSDRTQGIWILAILLIVLLIAAAVFIVVPWFKTRAE